MVQSQSSSLLRRRLCARKQHTGLGRYSSIICDLRRLSDRSPRSLRLRIERAIHLAGCSPAYHRTRTFWRCLNLPLISIFLSSQKGIVFVLVIVRVGSGNSRRDDASGVELGPVKASQSASARSRFPPLSISLDLSSPSVDQSRQTASHSSQHGIDNLDKSGPLLAAKGSFLINPRSDGVTWEEAQPYTPPSA